MSATTIARKSATQQVSSPSATKTGWSGIVEAGAAEAGHVGRREDPHDAGHGGGLVRVNLRARCARGCSVSTIAPCSMPGTRMSSTNGLSPSVCSGAALSRDRMADAVRPCAVPVAVCERGIPAQSELFAEERGAAAARARQACRRSCSGLAGRLNRVDDPPVSGAAAQMPVERLRDGCAIAGLALLDERRGADDDARECRSRTARRPRGRTLRPSCARVSSGSPRA